MYISGAKFEEHSSNISGDTCINFLDSVFYCLLSGTTYDIITFLISTVYVLQKREYR